MKMITRRQLSREPARLNQIKPGQSVLVPDARVDWWSRAQKKAACRLNKSSPRWNGFARLPAH